MRAHHVEIAPDNNPDNNQGDLPFTATAVEQLGGETYVYGTVADQPFTLHLQGQARVQVGDSLALRLDADHIHLFAE